MSVVIHPLRVALQNGPIAVAGVAGCLEHGTPFIHMQKGGADKGPLFQQVPVYSATLQAGDVMIVRPGEKIPTDGLVIEGESGVDESMATGESISHLNYLVAAGELAVDSDDEGVLWYQRS